MNKLNKVPTPIITLLGGIIGVVIVRYVVYSKPQIVLWKRFCNQLLDFKFQGLQTFVTSNTGIYALVGFGVGCLILFAARKKYII